MEIEDYIGILVVIVLVVVLLLVILVPFICFNGCLPEYSMGERTGDVYKFSEKGLIWKSWEGEMYLGGVVSGNNGNLEMEKFYFSLPKDADVKLVNEIKECSKRKSECSLEYSQYYIAPMWLDSSYVITKVLPH